MPKKVRDCWSCDYKEDLAGSCHVKCTRLWDDVDPPKAKRVKGGRWYHFPMNFDPIWQEEQCRGWAKVRNPKKTRQFTPIEDIIGIMGRRL